MPGPRETAATATRIEAELVAVLVAVTDGEPRVLTTHDGDSLPSGPFQLAHRSLQAGMRAWVESETHHPLGYIEQLYTFADRDRSLDGETRVISISYLGLTRETGQGRGGVVGAANAEGAAGVAGAASVAGMAGTVGTAGVSGAPADAAGWQSWYRYFPWEDRRSGTDFVGDVLAPQLSRWARAAERPAEARRRSRRVAATFGLRGAPWNEDLALQRYELLYEAGLVQEARRTEGPAVVTAARTMATDWNRSGNEGGAPTATESRAAATVGRGSAAAMTGVPMRHDHRRILATGIARLRAKIKYRPVVFELMPPEFTLLQLQQAVEALAGRGLHKQNFRRLIEQQALVEETGASTIGAAGRPAKRFRFRSDVLLEREIAGSKLPLAR